MPVKDFKGGFMPPPPSVLSTRLCKRPRDVHYVVEEEEELIIIEGRLRTS